MRVHDSPEPLPASINSRSSARASMRDRSVYDNIDLERESPTCDPKRAPQSTSNQEHATATPPPETMTTYPVGDEAAMRRVAAAKRACASQKWTLHTVGVGVAGIGDGRDAASARTQPALHDKPRSNSGGAMSSITSTVRRHTLNGSWVLYELLLSRHSSGYGHLLDHWIYERISLSPEYADEARLNLGLLGI